MIAGAYERCAKRSRRSNDARCVFQWSQRYSSWKVHHCTKTRFVVYPKHVIYSCCLSTPKVVSVVYSWGTRFFSCFFYKEWLRPSCRLFFSFQVEMCCLRCFDSSLVLHLDGILTTSLLCDDQDWFNVPNSVQVWINVLHDKASDFRQFVDLLWIELSKENMGGIF